MRSPVNCWILCAAIALWGGLCRAQEPISGDSTQAKASVSDTVAWFRLVQWRQWDSASRNYHRAKMPEEACVAAESAYIRSRALGINLPAAGLFWGSNARQAARAGDWPLAERYIGLANMADRYSLKNIITTLKITVRQHGWSSALGNAVQLAKECRRDFRCQCQGTWMAVFGVSTALMAGSLLFLLMLSVKEAPYLLHLASDRLPKGWPSWGRMGLVVSVTLGVTVAIAAFSLPLALLLSSLPLAATGKLRQRVMFWISLALVGCSLVGFSLVNRFFLSADRGRVETLSRANVSDWEAGLATSLAGLQEAEPGDLKPAYALALLEKRRGRLDLARDCLEAVIASAERNAYALNNLGNIYFFKGQIDSAAECYRLASEADPGLAEPHHNLAQVFLKRIDFNRAREQLTRAAEIDPLRMEIWSRESGGNLVMDALLEPRMLWSEALSGWRPWSIPTPGEQYALFGASFWLPWWVWLSWVVLAVLWVRLIGFGLARSGCQVCGRSICPRCQETGKDGSNYCSKCFGQIFSIQSNDLQQKAILSLERQGQRSARLGAAGANAILPGMSFVLSGGVVKAWLLSLAWGMVLACLALIRSPWVTARLDYQVGAGPYLAVGIVALVLWLASWQPFLYPQSFRREQDAAGR